MPAWLPNGEIGLFVFDFKDCARPFVSSCSLMTPERLSNDIVVSAKTPTYWPVSEDWFWLISAPEPMVASESFV